MSSIEGLKKDLSTIKNQWTKLDSTIKFLDVVTIASITIFTFSFFYVYFLSVPLIVTNVAFMIYPAIVAGYVFIYRSKLSDPEVDKESARKEFLLSIVVITLIILFSFVYTAKNNNRIIEN